MLEHNETLEYIRIAQAGDNDAKDILVRENLPLIKSIVKRYIGKSVEYDDLMQLGSLGLVKAIMGFDTSFNVRFSTYAVPMISGEIKRFLRDDGAIKVSRSIKMLNIKINQYIEENRNEQNHEPSISEIAKHFNMSEQDIVFAMDSNHMPISLYDNKDEEKGISVIDKIKVENKEDDMIDKIILKDYIMSLPDREKQIIIMRYYRDKTQSEIANIMGVSQVQISRIEAKVISKLKAMMLS